MQEAALHDLDREQVVRAAERRVATSDGELAMRREAAAVSAVPLLTTTLPPSSARAAAPPLSAMTS